MTVPSFETIFAVPMTCEACIKDISGSLYQLSGINKVSASLKDQLVSIEGTASPSAIVSAIQETGRDAVLRGSGKPNSAAVCILESHAPHVENKVRGLVRLVQVAPNLTIVDLSLRGLSPGSYQATVRENGDISQGPESTGGVWEESKAKQEGRVSRGVFGTIQVGKDGVGSIFVDKPIQIWELIGRGFVVAKQEQDKKDNKFDKNDADTLVGVIARSAGAWENDKAVCSCSGKTVWQEREEQVGRGML